MERGNDLGRWYDRSLVTELLSSVSTFDDLLSTREAKIGIVGLGYAGLPLAMSFAETGFEVTGVDLDEAKVSALKEGRSYLVDVPVERFGQIDGRLKPTTDYSAVASLDALTICVPTPLSKTRTPDLSYIVSAAESVAANLKAGQLVVLQSTTYPGTTEEIVLPILEASGGRVGEDFFLGYAPERVDPGNATFTIKSTPKLVAGVTEECRRRTELLYSQIVDTIIPCSSTKVAETAKIHENTFRAVNIALANELALMCDKLGISAWEVIEAAATKPFAFLTHYPGPGVAYKANVHDTRESPSFEIMRQLIARSGDVSYCDPWVPEFELDGVLHSSVEWSPERMAEADCVVLLTQHGQFLEQPLWDEARLIVDTRNVVPDGDNVKRI